VIEHKLVEDIKFGVKSVKAFALIHNDKPLVLPSVFLLHKAVISPSFDTVRTYMNTMKSFYKEVTNKTNLTNYNIEEMTEQEMSGYLVGILKRERMLKCSTIELHISVLKEFFKYISDVGLIANDPSFSFVYKEDETEQTYLQGIKTDMHEAYFDKETFKKCLLANVKTKSLFLQKRNELVLELGYFAGFRAAEIIHPDNLNIKKLKKSLPKSEFFIPKAIHMTIYGKGNKFREVPFPPNLIKSIYEFIWGEASHLISGNIICRENGIPLEDSSFASKLFRKCGGNHCLNTELSDDDVSLWNNRSYHKLRKCFATNGVTNCRDNGDDPWIYLPQWLGHSDIATSFKYIYFEALLNTRQGVLHKLSLEKTKYGKKFKQSKEQKNVK
jgi:site-specific recombinase XerD